MTLDEKTDELCKFLRLPTNGYAYTVIKAALRERDKDTRHACADAIIKCKTIEEAHSACMNAYPD